MINLPRGAAGAMKTEFVSLADRLREEGRERNKWTATENMLRKGTETSFICEVLEVTPEFVQKVREEMSGDSNHS